MFVQNNGLFWGGGGGEILRAFDELTLTCNFKTAYGP